MKIKTRPYTPPKGGKKAKKYYLLGKWRTIGEISKTGLCGKKQH